MKVIYLCELVMVNGSGLALVGDLEHLTDEVLLSEGFTDVLDVECAPVLHLTGFLGPVLVALDFAAFHQSRNMIISIVVTRLSG